MAVPVTVDPRAQDCLPPTFTSYQLTYKANRSTEDTISITLHTALSHLEHRDTYTRVLFGDYSSAFNTIIQFSKLSNLGLHTYTYICSWIKNFLTNRPQKVKLGPHLSSDPQHHSEVCKRDHCNGADLWG